MEEKGELGRKAVLEIVLTLFLVSVFTVAYEVTPVKAQVVLVGPPYGYIEIYGRNGTLTNMLLKGPCMYNSFEVTNVTTDIAEFYNISLVGYFPDGSRVEMDAPRANATKLMVYTTYFTALTPLDNIVNVTVYGNDTLNIPFLEMPFTDIYIKAVYLQAESFFPPLTPPPPVGGIWIPVDKLALLTPWIILAVATVAITVTLAYGKKRWTGKAIVQKQK